MQLQNKLDEESLARLKAAAAEKGTEVGAVAEDGADEVIQGGIDVPAPITANVWEVRVKVQCSPSTIQALSHKYCSITLLDRCSWVAMLL